MNTHVKITDSAPTDLSRRSFLVGSAATGLVLGYAAVPGYRSGFGRALQLSIPASGTRSRPDGLVTVTCGKADMGQHIASTMAQIVAEELGASWKDMRVQLASNDPKFNDPVLGAQITGGSWSTMMNFDAMSRAGAAGRIALIEAAAAAMGVPAGELVVRNSTVSHPKSKKSMSVCGHRQERQDHQDLHAGRAQGDQAEDTRSVHHGRRLGSAARYSLRRPTARPSTASTSCCRAWSTARWSRRRCASAPR